MHHKHAKLQKRVLTQLRTTLQTVTAHEKAIEGQVGNAVPANWSKTLLSDGASVRHAAAAIERFAPELGKNLDRAGQRLEHESQLIKPHQTVTDRFDDSLELAAQDLTEAVTFLKDLWQPEPKPKYELF